MNTNELQSVMILKQAMNLVAIARSKCAFFAQKARADGVENVARFFEDSARHKDAHYRLLSILTVSYGTTRENLEEAFEYEQRFLDLAPEILNAAALEENHDLVSKIERLISASQDYMRIINTLISQLDVAEVVRSERTVWRCKVCGNMELGDLTPTMCSVCESTNTFEEFKKEIIKYITGK